MYYLFEETKTDCILVYWQFEELKKKEKIDIIVYLFMNNIKTKQ